MNANFINIIACRDNNATAELKKNVKNEAKSFLFTEFSIFLADVEKRLATDLQSYVGLNTKHYEFGNVNGYELNTLSDLVTKFVEYAETTCTPSAFGALVNDNIRSLCTIAPSLGIGTPAMVATINGIVEMLNNSELKDTDYKITYEDIEHAITERISATDAHKAEKAEKAEQRRNARTERKNAWRN